MRLAHSAAPIFQTFSHNVVRGAGFLGLLIQNFLTGDASDSHSDGPATGATVTSNLFYNNGKALQATGGERGTDGGSTTLYMNGNVFRNNGENFRVHGGVSRDEGHAIGNRVTLRSESDTFGEAFANVSLVAGPGDLDNDPRGGQIEAEFLHSLFIRDSVDTPDEISIIGGAGRRNRAQVLIRDASVRTSDGVHIRGGLFIQNQLVPGVGTSTAKLEGWPLGFPAQQSGPAGAARAFFSRPLGEAPGYPSAWSSSSSVPSGASSSALAAGSNPAGNSALPTIPLPASASRRIGMRGSANTSTGAAIARGRCTVRVSASLVSAICAKGSSGTSSAINPAFSQ